MRRVRDLLVLAGLLFAGAVLAADELRLATFSADVTIPIGHRCMGILPKKAARIVDPLEARGFVLRPASVEGEPGISAIVLVAVDWCEIRNGAYERWREVLADAAGTTRERVLVTSVHQHDAPVVDLVAEKLLADRGLAGELCDVAFHERAVQRVAAALREGLRLERRVTHVGVGRARVERIASSRRVVLDGGRVTYDRGSASGANETLAAAPDGLIDPWLRTVSFWDGETPLAMLHTYATHPMSHYGAGEVSADFVGMARRGMQRMHPGVFQIYASGASGDVTAGKYNDGAPANRARLAKRLQAAMEASLKATRRHVVDRPDLRVAKLALDFHEGEDFTESAMGRVLDDADASLRDRILAAMGLASRARLARPIDVPCLDLGAALIVLFPGESFVGYQLMAQRIRPDAFVACVGYGECWPGYTPTRAAFDDGFNHGWRWAGRGAEKRVVAALREVLASREASRTAPTIIQDVFPATAEHPRYSEGSVLELDDGRLAFALTEFIGAGRDDSTARIVARFSRDGGSTWSESHVLQENVGKRNVMSVTLRRLDRPVSDDIGLFYLVKNGWDDLRVTLRVSSDELESFGEPISVTAGVPGYHVMNNDRVLGLLDGRLLAPVASTPHAREVNHYVSSCFISDDAGRSWRRSSGRIDLPKRGALEPGLVELRDGRVLMILRTQLGVIFASESSDRGETWSDPAPWPFETRDGTPIVSPESPATVARIPATGELLLVWNPKHVPGAGHGGKRTPLVAARSADDGRTWGKPLVLEPSPEHTFAYTGLSFTRKRVLMTYYVRDEASGRISTRFRSVGIGALSPSVGGPDPRAR